MNNKSKNNIFLVAGRTGGPFFPIPKIISVLDQYNPIVIGVKNSFEEGVCASQKLKLIYLPEAKLNILSFSKTSLGNKVIGVFDMFWNIAKLVISFSFCLYQILKFRPKLIYSTGSFLAVPLFITAKFLSFFGIIKTKLVVHQQDPLVGLSNKVCAKMADLKSCVFDYSKVSFPCFEDSYLIQNPILESKFEIGKNWKNKDLQNFLDNSNKSKLLIFGGGSGAEFINSWVLENKLKLTKHFDIVHLTGILQSKNTSFSPSQNYFCLEAIFEDMPNLILSSDYVICRAGLGTISELQFLQKKGFLVPIPNSHQELNAELVKDRFVILKQKNSNDWLDCILNKNIFDKLSFYNSENKQDVEYYKKLVDLVR